MLINWAYVGAMLLKWAPKRLNIKQREIEMEYSKTEFIGTLFLFCGRPVVFSTGLRSFILTGYGFLINSTVRNQRPSASAVRPPFFLLLPLVMTASCCQ